MTHRPVVGARSLQGGGIRWGRASRAGSVWVVVCGALGFSGCGGWVSEGVWCVGFRVFRGGGGKYIGCTNSRQGWLKGGKKNLCPPTQFISWGRSVPGERRSVAPPPPFLSIATHPDQLSFSTHQCPQQLRCRGSACRHALAGSAHQLHCRPRCLQHFLGCSGMGTHLRQGLGTQILQLIIPGGVSQLRQHVGSSSQVGCPAHGVAMGLQRLH